ncbi:MAG: carboxynorspermidine decarboxylase [Bacteroidota bacterium]|jgi:carboxynorspermidine decarboxylase
MIDIQTIKTPAYVLEESLLIRNLELMKRVQTEADVQIILAFKGFAMWSAFPLVKQYLAGATASSENEARLCWEEMGCLAHTYSPVYAPDEFKNILKYSSHITFNSLSQYALYAPKVAKSAFKVSCGLRVNPEYSDVATDLYNPCAPGSRLGILHEQLGEDLPKGIEGLHFHALCESSSYELEKVLINFENLFGRYLYQVKWVNFGGGHLMTRKDYDVLHLITILKAFKKRHPHLQVILEPGSAVAWQTGILISTVLDIVENRGVKTLMPDVSFTAHMPDTLEMPYRPKITGATDPIAGKPTYRIGGTSCLSGDFMMEYSFENEVKVGDILIFEDMIHYTMVKTTMFNGVAHPDIGIWKRDNTYELVRRFHYKDYKNRLS